MPKKEIIFVLDPMCSWCRGFAPVVETLHKQYGGICDFSLVMGGLRTRGEMPWNEASRAYLKEHWNEVSKRTGQTFFSDLFDKTYFEYDTYPACKAVITVRECFGMQEAFLYLHLLQEAFYLHGKDITSPEVLTELLQPIGLDGTTFERFYNSERAAVLMKHDFAKARSMGANAFPSVVIIDEAGHMVCQKGYRALEEMKKLLDIKDKHA